MFILIKLNEQIIDGSCKCNLISFVYIKYEIHIKFISLTHFKREIPLFFWKKKLNNLSFFIRASQRNVLNYEYSKQLYSIFIFTSAFEQYKSY